MKFLASVLGIVCLFVGSVKAELKIDVTGAVSEPIPVAMPVLVADEILEDVGEKITGVVMADLERSGLFRYVNPDAYIQQMDSIDTRPDFSNWRVINAQALVHGEIRSLPNGKIKVSFRLWDVFAQTQLEAAALTADVSDDRRVAHQIADMIYSRMTGESGYFDTKIVFVAESGPQHKRVKKLAVMDQDGENIRYLTDGKDMALSPRFSPNMQKIVYFSYKDGNPRVYTMDVNTGKTDLVGQFKGMSFAPRFSPDGKKLVMSLAQRGNTDIYSYHLGTGEQKRLTNHPAIDTSPCYSPDGKKIVFNSDRGGNQQLYVMDSDGTNVKRISFGEGTYATPVWSPRGDYIAFTKIKNKTFHIGVMRPDGTAEREIATGFLVEAPTWSPNGRVVAFYRQTPWDNWGWSGGNKIYTIDVTGHNEQILETGGDASAPAWSPLLYTI